MQTMFKFLLLNLIVISGLFNYAHADLQTIPALQTRLTDLTNTLSANQKTHIEQNLKDLEQSKGSQVAVLIVPTTKPESIEGYSLRVVEKWKLGREGVDDGVLLLIAKKDRKMRIEVGYGLEGAITDLSAGRIIYEYISPEFRRGSFYHGVLAGTGQITNLINGESLPAPQSNHQNKKDNTHNIFTMMVFASAFLSSILAPLLGRIITVSLITLGGAVLIWWISNNIIFTLVGALFLGFFSLAFSGSRSSSYRDGGGGYGGGFGGGGSSSSGGGFSGGGGGFGGGGASGGW